MFRKAGKSVASRPVAMKANIIANSILAKTGLPVAGQITYTPGQVKSGPARAPQQVDRERCADLQRSIPPEEANALTDAFGVPRTTTRVNGDPRGRHLDVRA